MEIVSSFLHGARCAIDRDVFVIVEQDLMMDVVEPVEDIVLDVANDARS